MSTETTLAGTVAMPPYSPEATVRPMPSTASLAARDVFPCSQSSVRLDDTCGLLDPINGLPRHLTVESGVEAVTSACPRFPAGHPAAGSELTRNMDWAMQGVMAPNLTSYPAPPTTFVPQSGSQLRDDPLGAVLLRPKPDAVAETLAEAIFAGDEAEVRRLLSAGADPNVAPVQGRHAGVKPLALSVRGARTTDIVRVLLDSGAAVCSNTKETGLDGTMQAWTISYVDPSEYEAETRAKLRLLIEYGADVHGRVAHTGDTALHSAAAEFQRRRSEGAGPKINRWTTKRTECAKMKFLLLLQARADPQARNRRNVTPLDLVSANFRAELPSQDNACQEPL